MDGLLSPRLIAAVVAFAAVALGVVTVALLWEGARILLRRRSVEKQLERLRSSQEGELGRRDLQSSLLKEERAPLPEWLEPLGARLPSLTDLEILLDQAKSSWSVGTYLLLTAGLAIGVGTLLLLFGLNVLVALAGAGFGAAIPYGIVVRRRNRRVRAFEEQFPEVIDLMARSARAGHAFQAGLQEVAEEMEDPAGEEFRQVFEEQRFGLPLSESLLGLADRIDLLDLQMFVTSVLIQKETGGNLAENLDNLSRLVRDRFRFKRDVRTHTAHGRMTGSVLGIAPIALAIILTLLSPDYLRPLWEEEVGRVLIAVGIGLQIVGFLVIRRMTEIEY